MGAELLARAEREAPGMLILCADFNAAARRFYARAGYAEVGAIPGLVLPGVAEVMLWKAGPQPPRTRSDP